MSLAIKAKNRKWRASKKEQERLEDPVYLFVMLVENARLQHDIIETDFVLVK